MTDKSSKRVLIANQGVGQFLAGERITGFDKEREDLFLAEGKVYEQDPAVTKSQKALEDAAEAERLKEAAEAEKAAAKPAAK